MSKEILVILGTIRFDEEILEVQFRKTAKRQCSPNFCIILSMTIIITVAFQGSATILDEHPRQHEVITTIK